MIRRSATTGASPATRTGRPTAPCSSRGSWSCLARHDAATWFDLLTDAGVPCAPIATVADGVALAERLGLEPVVELGPERLRAVASPLRLSATPATHRLPPPTLDGDGDELRAWLAAARGSAHS